MTIWTTYMPAGAGSMMLIAAVVLPGTSWRIVWLVAAAASALMLLALLLLARSAGASSIRCRSPRRPRAGAR